MYQMLEVGRWDFNLILKDEWLLGGKKLRSTQEKG